MQESPSRIRDARIIAGRPSQVVNAAARAGIAAAAGNAEDNSEFLALLIGCRIGRCEVSLAMQKLALTLLGALIGAGVGALAAMILRAGSIGPVLAVTGGCLWACYGYCIAGAVERSFVYKLGGLVFAPLVAPPLFLLLVLVMGAALVIIAPIAFVRWRLHEARLRKRMTSKGRYISLRDARRFLEAGRGTLIAEIGLNGTPYRIWFTEDDLSPNSTTTLSKDDLIALLRGEERPFNSLLVKEYVSEETGKAWLTNIPARSQSSGRLRRLFPYVKIAKVIPPSALPRVG